MKVSPSKLKGLLKKRGLTIKQFGKKLDMTRAGAYDLMKKVSVKEEVVEAMFQHIKQALIFIPSCAKTAMRPLIKP